MTQGHTPTPWKTNADDDLQQISIVACNAPHANILSGAYSFKERKEQAANIVKCVNAHDELVALAKTLAALVEESGPFYESLLEDENDDAVYAERQPSIENIKQWAIKRAHAILDKVTA